MALKWVCPIDLIRNHPYISFIGFSRFDSFDDTNGIYSDYPPYPGGKTQSISSKRILYRFVTNDAISLNLSRSLWVNVPIKEGRHECGQGNFLDSLSLRMLDIVKCWNFSGAWVDFSSARGLVSLLIDHLLPWLPKAGSLWDLEVQSTSLSHDSGINYIDLIRFFSGLKTNCITQTKWTWYSRWLYFTKSSNYQSGP